MWRKDFRNENAHWSEWAVFNRRDQVKRETMTNISIANALPPWRQQITSVDHLAMVPVRDRNSRKDHYDSKRKGPGWRQPDQGLGICLPLLLYTI
jgi:hypothetical protein